jgi:hypothetical protein
VPDGATVSAGADAAADATASTAGTARILAWLARQALRHRAGLGVVATTTLLQVAVDLARPWPMQLVVDHVLGDRPLGPTAARLLAGLPGVGTPTGLLQWSLAAILAVFLVGWALSLAGGVAVAGVGQRLVYDLGRRSSIGYSASRCAGTPSRRWATRCAG